MNWLYLMASIFLALYALLLLWSALQCRYENNQSKKPIELTSNTYQTKPSKQDAVYYKFSILVPFRNEQENLPQLWHAINQIDYPETHVEILFIDDHSEDLGFEFLHTRQSAGTFTTTVLKLSKDDGFGKKQALKLGVDSALHPWIITLDADVVMTPLWLKSINEALRVKKIKFLAGPVVTQFSGTLLGHMQSAEFSALQGLTKAFFNTKPILCNGANLVYEKSLFDSVSGFDGNRHLSSGDDVFLMEKIRAYNPSILGYNSDCFGAVMTQLTPNWKTYKAQQIRWFSKTTALKNWRLTTIAGLIFTTNLLMVIGFFLMAFLIVTHHPKWPQLLNYMVIYFAFKFIVDHIFLLTNSPKDIMVRLWRLPRVSWPKQIIASIIYPFWIVFLIVCAPFHHPKWKGKPIKYT